MNNKQLATLVYKHQLIQEILKKEIVDPSVINRLIVEEVLSETENNQSMEEETFQDLLQLLKGGHTNVEKIFNSSRRS